MFTASVCEASSWYVRESCSNNGNGTASNCATSPGGTGSWKGFSNIAWGSIKPSDTLYLLAGETYQEQLTINASGSSGSPITISVFGAGTAIIDGQNTRTGFNFNGNSFVTIDGLIGDQAFGGSATYGIKVVNIGASQYCAYENSGGGNDKVLHLDCSGVLGSSNQPDDNRGGIYYGGGGNTVEFAYNSFHTGVTEYPLTSCSQTSMTITCTATSNISDANWVTTNVIAIWGTSTQPATYGHCVLASVSGSTFTCKAGSSASNSTTGGTATFLWAATAITNFPGVSGTAYDANLEHDNYAHGLYNDGFRCGSNCSVYHNEASVIVGSGHSDSLLEQSGSYAAFYNNYVHDSNDQNCYLDNLLNATAAHIRVYNNIFNSPYGFGGCNVDPEGGSASIWDDIEVINNTSYASTGYMIQWSGRGAITNLVLLNNISDYSGADAILPHTLGSGTTIHDASSWDYNVYSPTHGTQYPHVASFGGGSFTLAGLKALSPPREVHGNACDVSYTDPAADDFHLASNDACATGAGLNLSSMYSFTTTDFDGNPRPLSGAWDLGAYAAGGPRPVPPTELTASVQ